MKTTKIAKIATATWAESVTERLLDLATMVIAYLYWKVCDFDDRATLEKIENGTRVDSAVPRPLRNGAIGSGTALPPSMPPSISGAADASQSEPHEGRG